MSQREKKDRFYPRKAKEMQRVLKNADKEGRLQQTLMEELQHPISMPAIWTCREYLHKVSEDTYPRGSSEWMTLLSVRALLSTMEDDLESAKSYIAILGVVPENADEKQRATQEFVRLATELVMPYISDNRFLHVVAALRERNVPPIRSLTLSASRPSILNGFRDFTRYGRSIPDGRKQIEESVRMLYGDKGKGVVEIALAEWYYQKNDTFHALVLAAGTIPLMESKQDIQCLFVAMALQMKILLLNGQTKAAAPLVSQIRTKIENVGWEELESSLYALSAWAACYDGNQEIVQEWMEKNAPDETGEFYMMDMYAYLVKVRCYLFAGKYMMALVLAKQLIHMLERCNRYMDICECHMLAAIACYKAGSMEDMCDELEIAIRMAKRYCYIRLLADEGAYMVNLLNVYEKMRGTDEFTDQIRELAQEVGKRLPNYMKSPAEYYEPLTATEKRVLRLLAEGLSYEEMGEKLGKKPGTVKFHSSGIFRKLQVKNRSQAVNKATQIGLI